MLFKNVSHNFKYIYCTRYHLVDIFNNKMLLHEYYNITLPTKNHIKSKNIRNQEQPSILNYSSFIKLYN